MVRVTRPASGAPVRPRRPFHVLTCIGAAAHHGFELGAGVGLVFQPYLGLTGGGLLWGTLIPVWLATALRGSARWDRALGFATGMSLGAVVLHFVLWPWTNRGGIPVLVQAEGLRPGQLPAYNTVLYAWAVPAAVALVRETPRSAWPAAAAGFTSALLFRGSAERHFTWVREQAKSSPAWWNRALIGRG
jgi:hypothetical protein